MSKRANLYTGRAGHLAVMAELLLRGWNTAIPEVDVGDDIFVVHDSDGDMHRVQVKTAVAKSLKSGAHNALFNLSLSQLNTPVNPEVIYIFVVRLHDHWNAFVVIDREALRETLAEEHSGSHIHIRGDRLLLRLRFTGASVSCGQRDLSQYRNNWTRFPIIEH